MRLGISRSLCVGGGLAVGRSRSIGLSAGCRRSIRVRWRAASAIVASEPSWNLFVKTGHRRAGTRPIAREPSRNVPRHEESPYITTGKILKLGCTLPTVDDRARNVGRTPIRRARKITGSVQNRIWDPTRKISKITSSKRCDQRRISRAPRTRIVPCRARTIAECARHCPDRFQPSCNTRIARSEARVLGHDVHIATVIFDIIGRRDLPTSGKILRIRSSPDLVTSRIIVQVTHIPNFIVIGPS